MNAVYASLICIAGAMVCLVIRQYRPELAAAAAMAAGVAALMVCSEDIRAAASALESLVSAAGLEQGYYSVMLRACGISLVAEFAAQICRDAGESALEGRIKLALRLALTVMAAPMIAEVLASGASFVRF